MRRRLPKALAVREWIRAGDPLAHAHYDAKGGKPQISLGPKVELAQELRFFGGWTPEVASSEASFPVRRGHKATVLTGMLFVLIKAGIDGRSDARLSATLRR